MEAIINLTSTGLVFGDLTIDWCKKISDNTDVSQTGMTLVERGNGFYRLTNPNITEDTDFYIKETTTPDNFAIGIFGIADGDIALNSTVAKEATLDTIMGGGFSTETLQELMVIIKTRLASAPYIMGHYPHAYDIVQDSSVIEGTISDIETVNQQYMKFAEDGSFIIDFDFQNIDELHPSFHFIGRYLGSAGHQVEVLIWNYTLAQWDNIRAGARDIPNSNEDIVVDFNIPGTVADYYSAGGAPYTARIRITHEPTSWPTHELWIDSIFFGHLEQLYIPADNVGIQNTNILLEDTAYGLSALKDIFDEIKGAGWTDETLKSIQDTIDSIDIELDTLAIEASLDEIKGTGFDTGQHSLKETGNKIG